MKRLTILLLALCLSPLLEGFAQNHSHNRVNVKISEVLELYNIASSLCFVAYGDSSVYRSLNLTTDYYQQVFKHFNKYQSHGIVKAIDESHRKNNSFFATSQQFATDYYIEEGRLQRVNHFSAKRKAIQGVYYGGNIFKKERALWEDFIQKTNFKAFFKKHQETYSQSEGFVRQLLKGEQMLQWLDKEFGFLDLQFTIIPSPLVGGLHSTFQTKTNRSYIIISDATRYQMADTLLAEALFSGIPFTEFDHHYCNPLTAQYEKEINTILSNKEKWLSITGASSPYYTSPLKIFDEYFTHAVHLLYVYEHYPKAIFEQVWDNRVALNQTYRGFSQFEAFSMMLLQRYQQKQQGEKVRDFMEDILTWCARQP